jgi:hypothetical protein
MKNNLAMRAHNENHTPDNSNHSIVGKNPYVGQLTMKGVKDKARDSETKNVEEERQYCFSGIGAAGQ